MLDRVRQERDAPQASVKFGGLSENYIAIAGQGLLQPYEPEGLEQVADIDQDAALCITFAHDALRQAHEGLPIKLFS